MECTDVESEGIFETDTFMIQEPSNQENLDSSDFSFEDMLKFKIKKQLSHLHKLLGDKLFNVLRIALFLIILCILIATINHRALRSSNNDLISSKPKDINGKKPIQLDDIFDNTFSLNYQSFKFIRPKPESMVRYVVDPGLFYTVNIISENDVDIIASTLFDPDTNTPLGKSTFQYDGEDFKIDTFEVNYDLQNAIVSTNINQIFRHSKVARYWFRDIINNVHYPIAEGKEIVNCKYSPAYRYIYYTDTNYNLYIQPINTEINQLGTPVQVTNDGKKLHILNGVCDWVYQEEVLATDNAVWFSPDDTKSLYFKQFEQDVELFTFPKYIPEKSEDKIQNFVDLKYPRPGGNLPKYEIHLVDLKTGEVFPIASYSDKHAIIYAVDWITSLSFIIRSSDRYSNKLHFTLYVYNSNAKMWDNKEINEIDFKTSYNGFVEKQKPIQVIRKYEKEGDRSNAKSQTNLILKNTGFAYLAPDKNGFQHIHYTESIKNPNEIKIITEGDYDILEITGYDNENNKLYFMSNYAHPMSKHLSSINMDTMETDHLQFCFSKERKNCELDYNEIELSMTTRWAYRKLMGPSEPELYAGNLKDVVVGIVDPENHNISPEDLELPDDMYILKLGDTESLKENTDNFAMPEINFKSFVLDDEVEIHYKEYLPPGYKDRTDDKFNLLVHVYGAPGSMTFNSKFSTFFESSISSSLNTIVLEIEPRGTGGKGWNFKNWSNNNIGTHEPKDFQEVVQKYIESHKSCINEKNVALWGWSYGGFITLKTLEYDKGETFKYGMAVAPVTDWKLYDAIYTERYLGDPNIQDSYNNAKINDYQAFKGVERFLIMTGTGDDNVHALNTYKLLDKFNLAEISNYDMQVFPDSDHKIAFHNGSKMVYKKLYKWIENAFNGVFEEMVF